MEPVVYRRIKASNSKDYINTNTCLIGRIDTFNDQKIVLDCGDAKINVSNFKADINELRLNEFLEVRGEPISDNIFLLQDFSKINSDFNLPSYNRTLELFCPTIDDYK
jgi:hypothetical protein